MSDASKTVSFRLPDEFLHQLKTEAKLRKFDSHHAFARELVINALSNVASDQHGAELKDLKQSIETLKYDLATATGALLAFAGKWTPEQARSWVQKTLLQKGD